MVSAAASRKRRRVAAKEGAMSPQIETLQLPTHLLLAPREPNPRSTDETQVVRDRDGRVLARIDTLRADLLPS
jgi:hypothetical protein